MTNATPFAKFIGLCAVLGLFGGVAASAGLPSSYALPFFGLWVALFLLGVGYIIDGGRGAKALISTTALTWAIAVSAAALIAWLVMARFG